MTRDTVHRFVRFALIGGIGFIVDAGGLLLMMQAELNAFLARVVSIALAMLVTWRLNRAITFGASHDGQLREGARYALVALGVAGLNYTIYAALLLAIPACPPLIATALSTGACMIISFAGYGRFAFRSV